jgi:hypothetical protein
MAGFELASGVIAIFSLLHIIGSGGVPSRIGATVSAWEEQCERQHGRVVMKMDGAYGADVKDRERIEKYIADHPELDGEKTANMRSFCAVPGMSKDEVRLLMNGPVEEIRGLHELSRTARLLEPELKNSADEAWLYETDTYFFAGGVLIAIQGVAAKFE